MSPKKLALTCKCSRPINIYHISGDLMIFHHGVLLTKYEIKVDGVMAEVYAEHILDGICGDLVQMFGDGCWLDYKLPGECDERKG